MRPPPDGAESSYRASGVDYLVLDAAKRRAIEAAAATMGLPRRRGARVVEESIGEPASLLEIGPLRLAVVLECLGTKSLIAGEVEAALGVDRFSDVGVDAVAAVVNDLCCVGALPLTLNAYFATGSASWYSGTRHRSLVAGWRRACEAAGAAWVGGESPTLAGIVEPDAVDLAGSALGVVPDGAPSWLGSRLEPGDEIVLVASSGLHANGASLARRVASQIEGGWGSPLSSGRLYGEAVLDPSVLYVRLVEALQRDPSVEVHYASHVTGHGLRKLMRAARRLSYRVSELPAVPEVLGFVAEAAGLSEREAYGTFNQGVGLALFAASGHGEAVRELAGSLGYDAVVGGRVEDGPRQVVLEPIAVTFGADELALR
ncbi:MAG: AIR synthase-related protein [Actinomycetota bacterium]|nr:AIR synthase-related protein [Actinomycetota bacterium]